MTTRVERLPFTVYDILGYLVPGFLLFIAIILILPFGVWNSIAQNDPSPIAATVHLTAFLFFSYALGHAIALVSAQFVEHVVEGFCGFPSRYFLLTLTSNENDGRSNSERLLSYRKKCLEDYHRNNKLCRRFLNLIMAFPIWCFLGLTKFFLYDTVVKPWGNFTATKFKESFQNIFKFDVTSSDLDSNDYFRLVEYFVGVREGGSSAKMYNYVCLYGFCRNSGFALWVAIVGCWSLVGANSKLARLPSIIDENLSGCVAHWHWTSKFIQCWEWELVLTLVFILSVVLMLGYCKFQRRYCREAMLAFIALDRSDSLTAVGGGV